MLSKGVRFAILALALAPVAASGDQAPQVELATPGSGDGAIERFTMRFSADMAPLGDPRAAGPVAVSCPMGGEGRWIDTRTFVWDFEKALPGGVSCTFKLKDGLKTLAGQVVGGQRSFTVDTGGPSVRAVLPNRWDDIEEDQLFLVAANVRPDPASVAQNGYCAVDGVGEKIALDVLGADAVAKVLSGLGPDSYAVTNFLEQAGLPTAIPSSAAEQQKAWSTITAVKCRRPLPAGRDMALVWGQNIEGAGRLAGRDQRFDFTVRKEFAARFECARVNPQAGCNPVQKAWVRFSAPIATETAKAIRIELPDGKKISPKVDNKGAATVSEVAFEAPLPAATTAKLVLPEAVKDESGRALTNQQRFPLEVRFDEAPPLVKFSADFGIIEAREGGVLPVTVRNVEPALQGRNLSVGGNALRVDGSDGQIAKWLRDIDEAAENDHRAEKRGGEDVTVNYTGTKALIAGKGEPLDIKLPGKGKDFEVVGIPLGKPGFYVVELASPRLGEALLGRKAVRYVTAGVLVTNMSVHFKWGRGASLAWVTALDSGKPVAGADIRVTDSCSGKALATGKSDGDGRVLLKELPEPETYGSCRNEDSAHPLMISARKGDDFSFTLTDWGKGIRPYDFDLPFGWSENRDLFHTVFDRTLIRQGETVNMKHVMRSPVAEGFRMAAAFNGVLKLSHRGSGTEFELPLVMGADGIGETMWTAPKGAPMGDYDLVVQKGDETIWTSQSVKVDEFRLPTMRATITGPKDAAVRPKQLPIDLFVGYLSGGGAANLPVRVRTAFTRGYDSAKGWDGWQFNGRPVQEGTVPLNGDGEEIEKPLPPAQTIPVTLNGEGTAKSTIEIPAVIDTMTDMAIEMDYEDANGEILTATRRIPLYPAAIRVGMKTDGWMMKEDDLRLKLVALDTSGKPVAGRRIEVALYSREILTARRRLIGGFYAYDNQARTTKLKEGCSVKTDAQGLAECALDPGVSGEVYAVATVEDDDGNIARASTSVWLAGEDDWWFGGDNGDRMDLIPEQKDYKAGDTARFQVRMPFREATALVTVEREGVLSSFVTTLSGKDPVVEVKMPGSYAPDVYVSVMAVRGRVGGFKLWLADLARRWNLPFFSREGASPTALVDLAKPSYRLGIAKVSVGWEEYRLGVNVKADRDKYSVRDTAQVDVTVNRPDGKPAASAEIAFAAVDEALLQLSPNDSWKMLDAMMDERPLSVLTSTAQTQVVGKRHYGRKAVEAGGGGGGDLSQLNREDFRPVLLWKGRVKLDAQGRARIPVTLSDSLSSFRLVAIATDGPNLFGTGETTVRTAQDLTIFSGLPPLVRTGDYYGASFTLRNASDRAMKVTATVKVNPGVAVGAPLTVMLPPGRAAPVTWNLPAPAGVDTLEWTVEAKAEDGRAVDRLVVSQDVVPAVPIETWAASLVRVNEGGVQLPITAPKGALPNMGSVDIRLSDTLAPPMAGVRDYMAAYPYSCFEQQLSRAIVLGDAGAWGRLAGELPAYLDSDGLVRYFPTEQLQGSEALTAYVLSVTAEMGWQIPESAKARMERAMMAVIDGRLTREAQWSGDDRLTRIAALAALARNGAATPQMIGQIGLAPQDMPTNVLADWLVTIDRTQGLSNAGQLWAAAEQVLRQRLVYEGSRIDLTDSGTAPWWMMSSGDEMAVKALIATIGKPGWQDDSGRMMMGTAMRQRRGHWDTTTANAWGALAVRRFAAAYPATAIAGTTSVSLGEQALSRGWPQKADAAPLRLKLPAAQAPLILNQSGGAGPWAMVSVRAAVPLTQPLSAGYKLARKVDVIQQKVKGRLTRGDVLRVTITVDASAERNWVVVNDPVPPGGTIIGGLGGQSAMLAEEGGANAQGVQPSYVERGKDAWRGYFEWVPRGQFTVSYAVRLNGSGRFSLPPTRVEALYSPDIRAAVPNAPVTVVLQ
ncbi:alpha-2-macroglobulin family protein [Sphingomonas sp. C3-2]|uniref:alpha-2-macroglobulin family protein n=1 Tax=Sphingomonas sp. C3-2 TaxID=3062169 RepID=UPI00294AC639|nr:MG2 domain-containing protein [Sphingomonas sp. C3-2]WOK37660.1 MG2 domain-containing protein [Sphingomonas sp. C3-2]